MDRGCGRTEPDRCSGSYDADVFRAPQLQRGDVKALAAHAPSIAEVGVLMDVGLVEIDQLMPVALGGGQYWAQPGDEGLPPRGIGTAKQLLGLLPRQPEPVKSGADGLAAARAGEP